MGLFDSIFGQKETTTDPMSYYTADQKTALQNLLSLANTGSGGGITLGEAYTGNQGNYDMTGVESQGLSNLMSLLQGGGDARKVYTEMANTKFNPDDPSSGFAAFQRQVARAQSSQNDLLNQQNASTGGRFNSRVGLQKAELQNQTNDSLQVALANLFNQSQDRKLQGASGLAQLDQNQIAQSQQYGGLERELKNQEAQFQYNEFLRKNNEKLSRIGLMQNVTETPMAPITTKSPSLFDKLLPALGTAAGSIFGGPIGGAIGGSLGKSFASTPQSLNPGMYSTQGLASSSGIGSGQYNFS